MFVRNDSKVRLPPSLSSQSFASRPYQPSFVYQTFLFCTSKWVAVLSSLCHLLG